MATPNDQLKYNPAAGPLAVVAPNAVPGAGLVPAGGAPKVEIPAVEKPIINANGVPTQNAGVETQPAADRFAQFQQGNLDLIGMNKGNPGSMTGQPAPNQKVQDSVASNWSIAAHQKSLNDLKAHDAASASIPKTEWNGVDPTKPPSFLGGNGGVPFAGEAKPTSSYMNDIKAGIELQKAYRQEWADKLDVVLPTGSGAGANDRAIRKMEALARMGGDNNFASKTGSGAENAFTGAVHMRDTDVHEKNANARSAAQDAISARNADLAHGESAMGMDKYQVALARRAAAGDVKAGAELRDLIQMFHGSVDPNNTVDEMGVQQSSPIFRTGPYAGLRVGAEKHLPDRSK